MRDQPGVCVGQIWLSESGNRWEVVGLMLPSDINRRTRLSIGKVRVKRLDPPKWDDGVYCFASECFLAMTLEGGAA